MSNWEYSTEGELVSEILEAKEAQKKSSIVEKKIPVLTEKEVELTTFMLEMLSETLGNNGCNDLDLRDLVPDPKERDRMYKVFCEWTGDPSDYEPYDGEGGDYRFMDWMLADYLTARLRGDIS